MICRRCKGKGWYWVQDGEDDVDRELCDCQEGEMFCECGATMEFIGTEWICKDCK